MSQALLQARAIGIDYDQGVASKPVLRNFDLTLQQGEIVTVLGPSGVGKSSLLRVLSGLQPPQAGSVELFGTSLREPHPQVALVFQQPALLPWLTLENNVAFGLNFSRQQKRSATQLRERVADAIDAVGLAQARSYYPPQLSGGMAQRAALARALARDPKLLLLDEPFGALDEITRADMQQLLLRIVKARDSGVILITHDIDEALLVSDRVLLLGGAPAGIIGEWHLALPQPRHALIDELGSLRIDILKTLRHGGRTHHPTVSTETLHVPGRSNSFAA